MSGLEPLFLGAAATAGSAAVGTTAAVAPVAASAGLFGAGGAFAATQTIATSLAALSAGSAIMGGVQQGKAFKAQAKFQEFEATQARIQGQQQENDLKEMLLEDLAANNAHFGFAGLDITSGTPVDIQRKVRRDATRQFATSRTNTGFAVEGRRIAAGQSMTKARQARIGGFTRASGSLLELV
jgi:hypothetical protein